MDALNVQSLSVDFGHFRIDNLNLAVKKGAITGLIGANGAGKTTLINVIMRALVPQGGSVLYDGEEFSGNEKKILSSVACVFDGVKFNIMLKPKKIVKIYKSLYPAFDEQKYNALAEKFRLPQNVKVAKYSFGMQKKLNFILAICQGAQTLILDEPTSGVDPFDRNELTTLLQEFMMDENHSVLFSTHITEDLDKIADYVVMLDNGRVALDADKDTLRESYRIVRAQTLTPEIEGCAIGLVQDMFGYTFLTSKTDISGEGMQVRVPTLEEIFVHLLNARKTGTAQLNSNDIFGL